MTRVPEQPKIYHITHLGNLPGIVEANAIWSDQKQINLGLKHTEVGMTHIKRRRLENMEVAPCHAGTKVGEYVPFYFCPRSVMLYILHKGNHLEIDYREGQQPILHLQADLRTVVDRAERNARRWAFTDGNAASFSSSFFNTLESLSEVDWGAVAATDFRQMEIKERKQAEFLVHESFPWTLVEKIGVYNEEMKNAVEGHLLGVQYHPVVSIERGWYY